MISNNEKGIDLNPEALKFLKLRIYQMERENHKTKKFSNNEMVERIRKVIETEVNKNDN